MATRLTSAAASAKQIGLVIIIMIPILIAGRFAWVAIEEATKPKPTPTPTYTNTAYGVLPPLKVPADTKRSNEVQLQLNTSNLQVPSVVYSLPTVPVIKYLKRTTNFDYINNVNSIASLFKISQGTTSQVSPTVFRLSEPSAEGVQIDVDIQYYHIKYSYKNPTAFIPIERGGTIDEATAINSANFLRSALSSYLEIPKVNLTNITRIDKPHDVKYAYRDLDGTIEEAENENQANLTEVKLSRDPYNTIPFVGPSTVDHNMKFSYTEERATVASGGANRPRLIEATMVYYPIDESEVSKNIVYPLRSVAQAYSELLAGKGYILSPSEPDKTYLILKAYLAYYEPREYMDHMTPVWVFEGDTVADPNFLFRAVVPAVATGWIQEP